MPCTTIGEDLTNLICKAGERIALVEPWVVLARIVDDDGDVSESFKFKLSKYSTVRKKDLAAVSGIARENR
jgi:hypothetical protein